MKILAPLFALLSLGLLFFSLTLNTSPARAGSFDKRVCIMCGGTKVQSVVKGQVCPACSGGGVRAVKENCSICEGSGRNPLNRHYRCSYCIGKGYVQKSVPCAYCVNGVIDEDKTIPCPSCTLTANPSR